MILPFSRRSRIRRCGAPIVVVSGLPRSGTSLVMRMLERGGLEVVSDGVRTADESNPRGYYECERVKTLDKEGDKSWLESARGKAIKIVSFLLRELPETNHYRVIFMHRDLGEIITSQHKMLRAMGATADPTTDESVAIGYRDHLDGVKQLITRRPCFDVLNLEYTDILDRPRELAERVNGFLGGGLEVSRMTAVVDRTLYRTRR